MATKPTPTPAEPGTQVAVKAPASTAVAMPGSWKDRMKQVAVQAAQTEKPTGGFISFKSGRLSIGDQVMPGDKIECVVIDYLLHNKYFDTPYNAQKPTPPVCYAFARVEDEMEPSDSAEDPQADFCLGCEKNEWGSDPKGGRGKACTNSRRLWLLPADCLNDPSKIARMDALQCDLPATSIKNFSKFVNDAAPMGLPPFAFVVEMSVKPHPTSLFQVHFKALEQIKSDAALEALSLRNWSMSQEPFPVYPTKEELAERNAGGSAKY